MTGRALSGISGKAKRIPIVCIVEDLSSQNPCGGRCTPGQDLVDVIFNSMIMKRRLHQQSMLPLQATLNHRRCRSYKAPQMTAQ